MVFFSGAEQPDFGLLLLFFQPNNFYYKIS